MKARVVHGRVVRQPSARHVAVELGRWYVRRWLARLAFLVAFVFAATAVQLGHHDKPGNPYAAGSVSGSVCGTFGRPTAAYPDVAGIWDVVCSDGVTVTVSTGDQ